MLKSKIHRAAVTGSDLNYIGSISIDPHLLELSDIREFEEVTVLDIDNGARFTTYAIVGEPGEICLNGAAARLVHRGDRIIILTFAIVPENEVDDVEPTIVIVDDQNRPVDPAGAH